VQINGKVPRIPDSIQKELRKAVFLRNRVVHTGVREGLKAESVDSVFLQRSAICCIFLMRFKGKNGLLTT
jgi:hypothetical protein